MLQANIGASPKIASKFHASTTAGEGPFWHRRPGFHLDSGELFVSGRCKDLIIVRGRNYHPQDIEQSVESCHRAIKPAAAAAFSIDAKTAASGLVRVQEIAARRKPIWTKSHKLSAARSWMHFDLAVDTVVLFASPRSPRPPAARFNVTPADEQFRARRARRAVLTDRIARAGRVEAFVAPRNETRSTIGGMWVEMLGLDA